MFSEHRKTTGTARANTRKAGAGEGAHRRVGGKMARDAKNLVGTACTWFTKKRRGRGAWLGDAAPRWHRRRFTEYGRHALPPQRGSDTCRLWRCTYIAGLFCKLIQANFFFSFKILKEKSLFKSYDIDFLKSIIGRTIELKKMKKTSLCFETIRT